MAGKTHKLKDDTVEIGGKGYTRGSKDAAKALKRGAGYRARKVGNKGRLISRDQAKALGLIRETKAVDKPDEDKATTPDEDK